MLKDTRRLFRHLVGCKTVLWCGIGGVYTVNLEGYTGYLQVTIDQSGGFEVRKSKTSEAINNDLIDKLTTDTGRNKGLAAYQIKKDKDLVKQLANVAQTQAMIVYEKDVDKIILRVR